MAKKNQNATEAEPATDATTAGSTRSGDGAAASIWLVDIPGCLIGPRYVAATSEAEAANKYKAPAGITSHTTPLVATLCDFTAGNLPEGVELFG